MPKIMVPAQKLWNCNSPNFSCFWPVNLIYKRLKSNFYCRNGILGVNYIGLDTSYDKIEDFTQNVREGQPPIWRGSNPQFFSRK